MAGPIIYMVDSSVVNVAIPAIARDLSSPLATVQWTVSGYLLTSAAGIAASAWLARRFGTLRAYVVSMAGFTLASVACAFAPTAQVLILTRGVQGLLGAQLVPLSLGLLLGRGGAMRHMPASIGMIFFVAPALGPAVGGVLVGTLGWQAVFWINAPIGVLAVLGLRSPDLSALGLSGSRDARDSAKAYAEPQARIGKQGQIYGRRAIADAQAARPDEIRPDEWHSTEPPRQ